MILPSATFHTIYYVEILILPFANDAVRLDPNGSALLESKTPCIPMGTTHPV
jgi:hypothetical protein